MGSRRDDLIVRAARLLCTTNIPCEKHLGQARTIIEMVEAEAAKGASPTEPLWTLAEEAA